MNDIVDATTSANYECPWDTTDHTVSALVGQNIKGQTICGNSMWKIIIISISTEDGFIKTTKIHKNDMKEYL